jgi:TolB-like protein
MPSIESVYQWLTENEALFSALAALVALVGVSYGVLRYILQPVLARLGSVAPPETDGSTAPGNSVAAPPTLSASDDTGALAPARKIPPDIADDHVSLAVLPFEALSTNENDRYIAAGIASEIIALITPVNEIRVSSRATAYNWQSGNVDAKAAALQINARFALTGNVRIGDREIRVIATLTDQESDAHIWTESYRKPLDDLFEVQYDIARSIVGATLGQVRLRESTIALKRPEHQLDAWGLLQKAYYFWLSGFSVDNVVEASGYLRRAIEIEPEYAAPKAALAMLLSQLTTSRACEDYDATFDEAKRAAEDAYRLRPNDADVLESVGVAFQNTGQGRRAVRVLRRAVELTPLNLISRGYLAMSLAFTGGADGAREAQGLLNDNFRIAPHHPSAPWWHWFLGVTEQVLGDYESSRAHCETSLQGQQAWVHAYFFLANALCMLEEFDEARHNIETARGVNPAYNEAVFRANLVLVTGSEDLARPFHLGLDKLEQAEQVHP